MLKKLSFILPLVAFLLIVVALWQGLKLHPTEVPSPLISSPIPAIVLPSLQNPGKLLNITDMKGQVFLLNVWATWCPACVYEHSYLMELAENQKVKIIGLDYKDDPLNARKWLKKNGNPYQDNFIDESGNAAIDLGVYGTPESYIIDKKNVIRYKHLGIITEKDWEETLKPLMQKLETET